MKIGAYIRELLLGATIGMTPLVVPAVFTGDAPVETTKHSCPDAEVRALTDEENALARSFFGDEIDTSRLRLHFCAAAKAGSPDTPLDAVGKHTVRFYTEENWSDNFAREANLFLRGAFLHELAHIVDEQGGTMQRAHLDPEDGCYKNYRYTLDSAMSFQDYCVEQKAALVEDYVRRFLHPKAAPRYSDPSLENDAMLARIVEERFPRARELREAYERKTKTTGPLMSL